MPRLHQLRTHILICGHKTCRKEGAREAAQALKQALKEADLRDRVMLSEVDCFDQCGKGPIVVVYPDGVWYKKVDRECARAIVERHLGENEPVGPHILCDLKAPG